MRARMALSLAGAEYEHREVLLRDKPKEMLELSPKGSVPVLVTNSSVIDESLDIMRWALPNVRLNSTIIDMIDGPFKHHLDRYKYASRYDPDVKRGDVDLDHRRAALGLLSLIESNLRDTKFLSGDLMGASDIASFPFIRQFAAVEPDWWETEESISLTRDWLKTCVRSELFQTIMQKHPVWTAQN